MQKKINIIYKNIEELIPYIRNARQHSDDNIAQIAASIKEFGWTNPVLIDGDNGIIAGHGRVLAGKKLGLKQVPCIELSELSDIQKRAYILADNKIAENSTWDKDLLKLELEELKLANFDIAITGFDISKLNLDTSFDIADSTDNGDANDIELNTDEFSDDKFEHTCPRCKFKFND